MRPFSSSTSTIIASRAASLPLLTRAATAATGTATTAAEAAPIFNRLRREKRSMSRPPSRCQLRRDGTGRHGYRGNERLLAAPIEPDVAHLSADGFGIERPPHRLGNGSGVLRALGLDDAAPQQLCAEGNFAGFEIRDLGLYGAELVNEFAGREVIELGYNGCSLGHDLNSCLGLGPVGRANSRSGRLPLYGTIHPKERSTTF